MKHCKETFTIGRFRTTEHIDSTKNPAEMPSTAECVERYSKATYLDTANNVSVNYSRNVNGQVVWSRTDISGRTRRIKNKVASNLVKIYTTYGGDDILFQGITEDRKEVENG